ncbi:MAG: DUF2652 domain-containing protein [Cyanobacteria bacterium P01_G01_bin.54]
MNPLQGHLPNAPQPAIFVIADITGYTRFMLANREALLHSQIIISELIRAILKQAKIPLQIAKLEGDAVFMYCLKSESRSGQPEHEALGAKLLTFVTAFMGKLRELSYGSVCGCSACRNMEQLRLKIVAHSGEALFYQLDRFEELAGPDVITVHRLLKNSLSARQYILLTDVAAQEIHFPDTVHLQPHLEEYADLGKIQTWVHELPDPERLETWQIGRRVTVKRPTRRFVRPAPLLSPLSRSALGQTLAQWRQMVWFMVRSLLLSVGWTRFDRLAGFSPQQVWRLSGRSPWMVAMHGLRWSISAVFLLGGYKLAFPEDGLALAQSYINTETGFISPFFAEQITDRLGISVLQFLRIQGGLEMGMGVLSLSWGAQTPMMAALFGFMFWAFTIAHPVVGALSLSRDIALVGFCGAIALTGPAAWGQDGTFRHRDLVLLLLRLSLSYTLIASALFTEGIMTNPLNTTLPLWLVGLLGLALGLGLVSRWAAAAVALWLFGVVGYTVWAFGIWTIADWYWGLEAVKREIALLVGAAIYAWLGRDCFAWPQRPATRPALESTPETVE